GDDFHIYSLCPLPGSSTTDSVLFQIPFQDGEVGFANSIQSFRGAKYVTVMAYAVDDGTTIIHELFHLFHFNINDQLKADPIDYLEESKARILLRAEYYAMRQALQLMDDNAAATQILSAIHDVFTFKKIRQQQYAAFHDLEIQIEMVEGLANYTGFLLSGFPNKYKLAIKEIEGREAAPTYTRAFPYATGPAYGIFFDYLGLNWKTNLEGTYDFLQLYETLYLKDTLALSDAIIAAAKERNNYEAIEKEEKTKQQKLEQNIAFYKNLLVDAPTLSASLTDNEYSISYDMYGTLVLKDIGLIYSSAKGSDMSGANFGSYEMKAKLGQNGLLGINNLETIHFPLPIRIEGNKVIGEFYTIDLNDGWEVVESGAKGDLKIIKKE
ncbi:MAG: hypothetical protein AAGI49_17080, partial [Bacteroidota bacterium]